MTIINYYVLYIKKQYFTIQYSKGSASFVTVHKKKLYLKREITSNLNNLLLLLIFETKCMYIKKFSHILQSIKYI